jgi:hypothetical protein
MQQSDLNVFLQSLRRNQPMIVLAFLLVRRAMTLDELETCTGLDYDTVRSAVKGLASKDLLHMQRGERGKQTWLPVGDTFFGSFVFQKPVFSVSEPTTTTARLEESKKLLEVAVGADNQKPKFSVSDDHSKVKVITENEPESKNKQACFLYGIGEPMATRISELEWVTPDFIRDHVRSLVDGESLGLAIVRIRSNELPRLWEEEARQQKRPKRKGSKV